MVRSPINAYIGNHLRRAFSYFGLGLRELDAIFQTDSFRAALCHYLQKVMEQYIECEDTTRQLFLNYMKEPDMHDLRVEVDIVSIMRERRRNLKRGAQDNEG